MRDTIIENSPEGGLKVSGGHVSIEAANFNSNNPLIAHYPSLRRNIACTHSGNLEIISLKGGDGLKENSSLWILENGCALTGIISERASSFFIPVLESVEMKETGAELTLSFKGMLLLPCNLSFAILKEIGDEEFLDRYIIDEGWHVSEKELLGKVPKEVVANEKDDADVSVHILFGNPNAPSSTDSFILKNRSKDQTGVSNELAEGGKEGKSSWALIVIIMLTVLFLIVLIVSIIFIARWKKAKERTEELEEIVEDTVKKDPKILEMITMEITPNIQQKKMESEAKKVKRRMCKKKMQHSESTEYLLSKSESTENILGRDSDKDV
ncbi:uncharacterized protein MONOS_6956c2 [Monocercomonoides exilis]|uniref:uncharacterized protein n=1 Tax=Monocercomonoides exilis TaxID=2049356 RepID=UPI003559620C|nr:hypothetical protein MONOS_6956c1 [Monocercomonoides exilis]KAH7825238.1 hypothetical protein MONOS_6956c2 [Monocercomonoides exilis]|eukprot:MONOS_6956.1-p1 / transcript=MONOS_6956.1 / gene=MONOS_6956 / organism=Monocercomonoides_exilis_PA203 / gene_product=unspecified product / transcript_product=unspecified product / location=Mono_scaffold00229:3074-4051(-) / protein_length=326 / sequence_SO=supercontig / SO=protein_coding / is_pseudo=false